VRIIERASTPQAQNLRRAFWKGTRSKKVGRTSTSEVLTPTFAASLAAAPLGWAFFFLPFFLASPFPLSFDQLAWWP